MSTSVLAEALIADIELFSTRVHVRMCIVPYYVGLHVHVRVATDNVYLNEQLRVAHSDAHS